MEYSPVQAKEPFVTLVRRSKLAANDFGISDRPLKKWMLENSAPLLARKYAHAMCGDFGVFHQEWLGFRICRLTGDLFTNENLQFSRDQIRSIHFLKQGLATKRAARNHTKKIIYKNKKYK